jgi:FkbM family methyltransferase
MLTTFFRYVKMMAKLALGRGVRKSYGHQGEDAVVQALLKNVEHGVYVDVGAYHPTLYSNTYVFYKKGWDGIVIDANKDMAPLYALVRPRDTFVHTAIGPTVETKQYYMFADGAYNSFEEERARGWEQSRGLKIKEVRDVSFKPLSAVLKEHTITHIDFLNVDVEGMDFKVLQTHDWAVKPRVIAVEDESFNPDAPHENQLYLYLREKGYELIGLTGMTLIFRRRKEIA